MTFCNNLVTADSLKVKMATNSERKQHVFFMDSRGEGLTTKVAGRNVVEPFEIKVGNGATLGKLVARADTFLYKFPFHVAYIAGGICDVKTKDKCTGGISFDWNPPGRVGPHLVSSLERADELLAKKNTRPQR